MGSRLQRHRACPTYQVRWSSTAASSRHCRPRPECSPHRRLGPSSAVCGRRPTGRHQTTQPRLERRCRALECRLNFPTRRRLKPLTASRASPPSPSWQAQRRPPRVRSSAACLPGPIQRPPQQSPAERQHQRNVRSLADCSRPPRPRPRPRLRPRQRTPPPQIRRRLGPPARCQIRAALLRSRQASAHRAQFRLRIASRSRRQASERRAQFRFRVALPSRHRASARRARFRFRGPALRRRHQARPRWLAPLRILRAPSSAVCGNRRTPRLRRLQRFRR